MSAPEKPQIWVCSPLSTNSISLINFFQWQEKPTGGVLEIRDSISVLGQLAKITFIKKSLPIAEFFDYLHDNVLQNKYVLSLMALPMASRSDTPLSNKEQELFNSVFSVGPGGIINVLNALSAAYDGLQHVDAREAAAGNRYQDIHEQLCGICHLLLVSVRHFRARIDRKLWDPDNGIREFRLMYGAPGAQKLPVGLLFSTFYRMY